MGVVTVSGRWKARPSDATAPVRGGCPRPWRRPSGIPRGSRGSSSGCSASAAAIGFLVYPTYPNYDSYYSLLWGREVLDLQSPTFEGFRIPTEHPLAIAAGALLSLLGSAGDRVWVAVILATFLWLVAGVYRLGRVSFTPLVGAAAAALLLTRLDYAFLAARGYIDIPYMAMVVWAAALEAQRPRRGAAVLVLLTLAGLLRPEAWVLAALYWCWVAWKASWRDRILLALLAAVAPVAVGADRLGGDRRPAVLAALHELLGGGPRPPAAAVAAADRDPRVLRPPGEAAGAAGGGDRLRARVLLAPRRAAVPLGAAGGGIVTFVLIGIAGASAIERYLAVAAVALLVFAGVGAGRLHDARAERRAALVGRGGRRRGAVRDRVHGAAPQPRAASTPS